MCIQCFILCFKIEVGREECSNLWECSNLSIFSRYGCNFLLKFPGKSKIGLHNKYIKWQKWHMQLRVRWFYFRFWLRLSTISNNIYEKLSFLGIFSCLGCFLPVFGKVKVWLMSELHEKKEVSLVVAFPIFFFFKFSDRGRHGGLLKLMKKDPF